MQTKATRQANHLAVAEALEIEMKGGIRRRSGVVSERKSITWGGALSGTSGRGRDDTTYVQQVQTIAYHLERAGKLSKAINFYFRAGKSLLKNGSDAARDAFEQCNYLAELLGEEISQYMRATYSYELLNYCFDSGYFHECWAVGQRSLKMLGGEMPISDFNTGMEVSKFYVGTYFQSGCCRGTLPPLQEAAEEQLKIKILTRMATSCLSLGKGKKVRSSQN